ncbi:Holliday junction branch migration DNA helicase RuvB [Mesoplasma photuris]|uniref:Holliday junction branch migration DNA helicase RuvB n=1 Tax=Mesoplasma photuris TaxID=217731 RepID=UPI0004E1714F|nr:Holliday junction branch migration DNA helicase RuvB [Mesoplasma photuris]
MSNNFRPKDYDEYFGQPKIINNLQIYIASAIKRETNLDHIILSGASGMGKTSLAYLIANVLKRKIHILNGPTIQKQSDVISVLTALKEFDVLFIDEVHCISKEIFELLYPVIEDNKINILIGKDYNSKVINIKLPKFTLIVATTEIDRLPVPFINRFPISFELQDYTDEQMAQISLNTAHKLNLPISIDICTKLGEYGRKTPRILNNLMKRIHDFYIFEEIDKIDETFINYVLKRMDIYECGLTKSEINYLNILNDWNVLGVESIAHHLNLPISTIIKTIEPYLIKNNLITKKSRGRALTQKGFQVIRLIK